LLADRKGNRALVGIGVLNIVIYTGVKAYYVWRNKQRDKVWDAMTSEVLHTPCPPEINSSIHRFGFEFN
jgi:hypothetical protein